MNIKIFYHYLNHYAFYDNYYHRSILFVCIIIGMTKSIDNKLVLSKAIQHLFTIILNASEY